MELNQYDLAELDSVELQETQGGGWFFVVLVEAVVAGVVADWADFKQGFKDGVNASN